MKDKPELKVTVPDPIYEPGDWLYIPYSPQHADKYLVTEVRETTFEELTDGRITDVDSPFEFRAYEVYLAPRWSIRGVAQMCINGWRWCYSLPGRLLGWCVERWDRWRTK